MFENVYLHYLERSVDGNVWTDQKSEVRGQRSEVRGQRSEIRDQRSEGSALCAVHGPFLKEILMQRVAMVFCFVTLMLAAGLKTPAQTSNPCESRDKLPPAFYEVPPGPEGNWNVSHTPDLLQSKDPLVPVVVTSVGSLQAPFNPLRRRGIRFGCGTLKNRSQKLVTAVQFRWVLIRGLDVSVINQKGYTPETVLLEGNTPPIESSIPKDSERRTDFSIISFVEVMKDLTREGVLTGEYFIFVGVYSVRFEDGSVWNAGSAVK
jgi:hypothetical protein